MRTAPLAALAVVSLVLAGTAPPEKAPAKKPPADSGASPFYLPRRLDLTDEQWEKLRDLRRTYSPKLEALELEMTEALTPEQKRTADEARQAAAADGKRGRQLREAALEALAALGVPASARAKYRRADALKAALLHEIREKKIALLTPQQREQLKPKVGE
jgi:Spy/CpxP family protein refolding chaperone